MVITRHQSKKNEDICQAFRNYDDLEVNFLVFKSKE